MMAQRQTVPAARPLRADAERTMTAILEAAERILSRDPAATMEQVAEAAGVARTTVHRRFATREALIDALGLWVTQRLAAAVDAARPDAAPPLVALYEATANVLRVKATWSFAMSRASAANPEVARLHAGVRDACERLFRRAQQTGLLRADADLAWTQRVYYALLHEATASSDEADADAMATLVVDTLLRGAGTAQPGFGNLPALPDHGPRGVPVLRECLDRHVSAGRPGPDLCGGRRPRNMGKRCWDTHICGVAQSGAFRRGVFFIFRTGRGACCGPAFCRRTARALGVVSPEVLLPQDLTPLSWLGPPGNHAYRTVYLLYE